MLALGWSLRLPDRVHVCFLPASPAVVNLSHHHPELYSSLSLWRLEFLDSKQKIEGELAYVFRCVALVSSDTFFCVSQWTFHPFVCTKKQFYTVLVWCKILTVFVMCQTFRVLSFTATQLPGPAHHCRQGSPTAILKYTGIQDVLYLNAMHGCGDLIFSSHMTFILTVVITYSKYGTNLLFKHLSWLLSGVMSVLIIASRKHYTVDVVIAWYVVPLVYYFVEHKLEDNVGPRDLLEHSPCDKILPLHSSPFHLSSQLETSFEAQASNNHAYTLDQNLLIRSFHGLKYVWRRLQAPFVRVCPDSPDEEYGSLRASLSGVDVR
ncbi:unnamed protein product [Closterium sp. NIES-65]|nr:unnamed protein product [Closterium sp. NIES-65]